MQSVVRQLHVGKSRVAQSLVRFRVRQIVRDVREPRAPRPQLLHQRQRLRHRLMHRMRNIPQRIDDQIVQPLQQRHRRFRQRAEIRQIRRAAKSITQHLQIAMHQRYGNKFHAAQQLERLRHRVQLHDRHGAQRGLAAEHIRKRLPQHAECFFISIHRHRRALAHVEWTDVIETHDVIGVPVRQQNRIQSIQPRP